MAATGAVAVALLALGAGRSYASHLRSFVQGPEAREIRAERQRRELYAWLKAHTDPGARVLCWDDVKLYLYTGRKAIWPLAITPQMLYTGDRGVFERDRQHLLDTARHVGARYWVKAPNNFLYCAYNELYLQAEDEMLRAAPVIFQSSDGQLRLYDISCLIAPSPAGDCGSPPGEAKRAGI